MMRWLRHTHTHTEQEEEEKRRKMDGIVPTPFHMCVYTRIQDNLNRDGFLLLKIFQVVLLRVDDNLYQSVVYIYTIMLLLLLYTVYAQTDPKTHYNKSLVYIFNFRFILHLSSVCVCVYKI